MTSLSGFNDRGSPAKTLGDIVDADTAPATPESEWIDLVHSVAAGDQRALRALYERAHRIVFTLAMRITQNCATAEEVTIDVFLDVWRRASTYEPVGGTVVGWIMNQTRSRALDRVRLEQRKNQVHVRTEDAHTTAGRCAPDDTHDAKEQARELRKAVSALTPDEREAIETAYFPELTYSEVAVRLNQPPGTVKTRIRSGLGTLRQAFDRTVKTS